MKFIIILIFIALPLCCLSGSDTIMEASAAATKCVDSNAIALDYMNIETSSNQRESKEIKNQLIGWCPSKDDKNIRITIDMLDSYIISSIDIGVRLSKIIPNPRVFNFTVEYKRQTMDGRKTTGWIKLKTFFGILNYAMPNSLNYKRIATHLRITWLDQAKDSSCIFIKIQGCQFKSRLLGYFAPNTLPAEINGVQLKDSIYDVKGMGHNGLGYLTDNNIQSPQFIGPGDNPGYVSYLLEGTQTLNIIFEFLDIYNVTEITFDYAVSLEKNLAPPSEIKCMTAIGNQFNNKNIKNRLISTAWKDEKHDRIMKSTITLNMNARKIRCQLEYASDTRQYALALAEVSFSTVILTLEAKRKLDKNYDSFSTEKPDGESTIIIPNKPDGSGDDGKPDRNNDNTIGFFGDNNATLPLIIAAFITVILVFVITVACMIICMSCIWHKRNRTYSRKMQYSRDIYGSASNALDDRYMYAPLSYETASRVHLDQPYRPLSEHRAAIDYRGRQLPDVPLQRSLMDSVKGTMTRASSKALYQEPPDVVSNVNDYRMDPTRNIARAYAETDLSSLSGGLCGGIYDTGISEYPFEKLIFQQIIGKGEFAEVHMCEAPGLAGAAPASPYSNPRVAAKMLSQSLGDEQRTSFMREVNILKELSHPNLIKLLGIVSRGARFVMLFEYMENGDLYQFLRKKDASPVPIREAFSLEEILKIIRQIACGLTHLEAKKFIHRDLATRNCLVGAKNVVKIGDFGMSRELYSNDYYKLEGKHVLPIRWMSWEAVYNGKFSTQSDVWSFGVLIWEVLTFARSPPFPTLADQDVINNLGKFANGDIGEYLGRPHNCPDHLYELMCRCWATAPSARPTAHELYTSISDLCQSFPSMGVQ